ncbi:hypothetical protein BCR35DRAFT_353856 [Leucosporidium creatinivorum]|uniref:Uncharacterized protein n=1 Tax=Leucosporidium creatinivorum TaxID=106004 RepID=A0A1Y2ESK1_9BASI|nr:hypothetical protein BCR35DRAFT_353856 [Leucosporidium creatinivorum]
MLSRAVIVALLGLLAALSLALPFPISGISYNSVSLLNDDSYNKTSLDVHDETETTTKLTIIDADDTDADISNPLISGEVSGNNVTALQEILGLSNGSLKLISVEITNKTSHDLDYDNETSTNKDLTQATSLKIFDEDEDEDEEAEGGGLYRPFYGSGRPSYRYPSWYEDPDYSPRRCYFA